MPILWLFCKCFLTFRLKKEKTAWTRMVHISLLLFSIIFRYQATKGPKFIRICSSKVVFIWHSFGLPSNNLAYIIVLFDRDICAFQRHYYLLIRCIHTVNLNTCIGREEIHVFLLPMTFGTVRLDIFYLCRWITKHLKCSAKTFIRTVAQSLKLSFRLHVTLAFSSQVPLLALSTKLYPGFQLKSIAMV